jgi:hypothetical protein
VSKHPKHHYIPVFYLKEWTDDRGRLLEFSRPYDHTVKARPTSPDGTGYIRGLNILPTVADPEMVERAVMQKVDSMAADAHRKLLNDSGTPWTVDMRSAWTRFLISLLFRNPEAIERTIRYMENPRGPQADESRKLYDAAKDQNDPSFDEYLAHHGRQAAFDAITRIFNNEKIGIHINTMKWIVHDLSKAPYPLLASDRPMIATNGIAGPNGHIIMPLSLTKIFIAVNDLAEYQRLKNLGDKDFAASVNFTTVRNAIKYIWSTDTKQHRFISNHMSANAKNDPDLLAGAIV